jgi:periplasmic protein TonB
MERSVQKNNKLYALIGSLVFHGALMLIFVLAVFRNPDPPLFADSGGVEVNFGNSEEGMGDIQPEKLTEPEPARPQKAVVRPPKESIQTQDLEESPVTAKEPPKEPVKEPVKEPAKEVKEEVKQPAVNPQAIYKGKKSSNTANAGNEGETGKPGDQGIKEGSLYSKTHGDKSGSGNQGTGEGSAGSGGGKGVSYSLSGRKMLKVPEIVDRSQESGKVVVNITVDKYGNVTRAVPGARGSTTTSAVLYSKAQQAALRAKFDANPEAAEEQYGTITFVFILQ